ncbi:neuroguidin [Gadus morhua]|uniref:Neuroguidin, EIF4E binding protein n=1 Tax=Gadus morhua TaxID=8049 RepID=A0A8C4Z002_GADMO|nr:neuroguidin [Gadus morhua]
MRGSRTGSEAVCLSAAPVLVEVVCPSAAPVPNPRRFVPPRLLYWIKMAASIDNYLIESDLPKAENLLNLLTEQVVSVTGHIRDLQKKIKDGVFQTAKGLSFLDLRYQLLLFYLQDLTHLISLKTEGAKIKESQAIERVMAVRTVLEKMRPLDHKLKYQIDKLVRTAVTGSLAENDPLHLRPNPENLMSKLSESEESGGEDGLPSVSEKKTAAFGDRKYIPPKIAPMHYDGDVTEADRKKEQQDRLRRSALRSSVIQELREQYSDTPEEIRDRRDFQTERQSRDDQHRKNYEESMMVRLNVPKAERLARKRSMQGMSGQLNSITHFSDISALTGGAGRQDEDSPRPKKQMMKKKTKKRAFKKYK